MTRPFQPWRRRVHYLLLAIFAGTPFLQVGGESALRFDVPTLRLHLFGAVIRMDEFFTVLLLALALAFLFIWLTVVYGRIWCGWLCPQAVLVDLTRKHFPQLRILVVSVAAGAVSVWYFVPPSAFFSDLAAGRLGPVPLWSWVIIAALTWLNLQLVRYSFCATVCPYSRFQGVMFDRHTLAIAFDEGRRHECIDCTACLKSCPVGIDIREGLQAACVNCTECIDTCARVMGRKGKKSLVGFFFGGPGGSSRPYRPASAIPLAAAAVFFILFLFSVTGRQAMEASLLPRHVVPPRYSSSGRLVNSFELSIENRGGDTLELKISAQGTTGEVRVAPRHVAVGADEHRRIPVTVSAPSPGAVDILIEGADGSPVRLSATILSPE